MKAFLAIKFEQANNTELIDNISQALENCGVETFCFVRDFEKYGNVALSPEDLMKKAFEYIKTSDILIVELSKKAVGIGIEAGYAYALGIPILTIAKKGSDISSTLEGISNSCFLYDNLDELVSIFREYFSK
jgi:2'-deoxynucleoside 5'-phosphate N-hydrolase